MGVLNVTPDSFSDGGRFLDARAALAHARSLAAEGADILDVGAEFTRPYGGAVHVSPEEERARLAPVLSEIVSLGVPVSIDTLKASIAAWALDLGVAIVNDVWGLQRDPDMAGLVADRGVPIVVMHNRERADPDIDIVDDVTSFFERSLDIAARAGVRREQIVLDPGIGFGKTPEQSMTCIARLNAWHSFGLPILVGASRKRFINAIVPSEPAERLGGSLAAHLLAVENGAAIVRVARCSADSPGACSRCGHQAGAMSDAIFVNGLIIHAYHGVMPHEAKVGQPFGLDLVLDIDLGEASRTDKLQATVSYEALVKVASVAFSARRYRLVEAAAGAVAEAVLAHYPQVRSVRVTVRKPHAPIAATFDDVGVIVTRARQSRGNDRNHG